MLEVFYGLFFLASARGYAGTKLMAMSAITTIVKVDGDHDNRKACVNEGDENCEMKSDNSREHS